MTTLNFTTISLGIGLAAIILILVRRDRLHLSDGAFWILVAAVAALLGIWPALIDRIARVAGIQYSPSLLLLFAVILLLVKSLLSDIAGTRLERQVRRLNQRLALYEAERTHERDR